MNRKTKSFIGAFAITMIFMGAAAGFIAVDLSTDRYMPDQFGPFFEVTSIKSDHIDYSFLAGDYSITIPPQTILQASLAKYRGLLPAAPRISAAFAAKASRYALENLEDKSNRP